MCKDGFDFVFNPAMLYYCEDGEWQFYVPILYSYPQQLPWPDCSSKLIAELQRAKRASEAPWVRKIGNPTSRENLVMTSPYERANVRPSLQTLGEVEGRLNINMLTETCSLGLPFTSLILDIHVTINDTCQKQGICWPVPRDYIAGSSVHLIEVTCFFEVEVLVFDWIVGSCHVNLLKTGQDCSEAC